MYVSVFVSQTQFTYIFVVVFVFWHKCSFTLRWIHFPLCFRLPANTSSRNDIKHDLHDLFLFAFFIHSHSLCSSSLHSISLILTHFYYYLLHPLSLCCQLSILFWLCHCKCDVPHLLLLLLLFYFLLQHVCAVYGEYVPSCLHKMICFEICLP